jgi:hypothetical protein
MSPSAWLGVAPRRPGGAGTLCGVTFWHVRGQRMQPARRGWGRAGPNNAVCRPSFAPLTPRPPPQARGPHLLDQRLQLPKAALQLGRERQGHALHEALRGGEERARLAARGS